MRHVIDKLQDLLEGLHNLRLQQKELLACTESQEVDALPLQDFQTYQRLQREREAKGKFLFQIAGKQDDLSILLDQIQRLSEERKSILNRNNIDNALELPLKDLHRFTQLWEQSDFVAGLLEGCMEERFCE